MRIFFLTCVLLFAFGLRMSAQEIFIKTVINSTTYYFRSSDGTKLLDFSSGMGNSIEMGMGFPFVPKTKKEGAPEKERSYSPNWFKNEVSLNLDSFNKLSIFFSPLSISMFNFLKKFMYLMPKKF